MVSNELGYKYQALYHTNWTKILSVSEIKEGSVVIATKFNEPSNIQKYGLSIVSDLDDENNCNQAEIMLIGASKSGKSSIVNQYLHNVFHENYLPTYFDFFKSLIKSGDSQVNLT